MTIDEILKNATPRPWRENDRFSDAIVGADGTEVCDFESEIASEQWQANVDLTILAVNSFEKQRECIRELGNALEDAEEELRLIRMKDANVVYDPTLRARIMAALAKAKELL